MRCRVNLWEPGATRGPSKLITLIEDAGEVAFSEYANAAGEAFFTLPYNHYAHDLIEPLVTHMEIQRQDAAGMPWTTLKWALVTDHDTTSDSTVYYGDDYLSLFGTSITGLKTTYTNQPCSTVIHDEALLAINQSDTTAVSPDSRLGFVALGHIDTTATTATFMSDYESRLALIRNAALIVQQGNSQRPIFSVSRSAPFTFDFYANRGVHRPEINLEYGGLVDNFRLRGSYSEVASWVYGAAQKTAGASIMYSSHTGVDPGTYGIIQTAIMYSMLPDQDTLDKMVASDAQRAAQLNRDLWLSLRNVVPYDGYEIGDGVPVTIKRGKANLDKAYYTIWGLQWRGHSSGSETLSLSLLPEVGGIAYTITPPPMEPSPPASDTPSSKTYQVVKGDSINRIGTKFGVSARALIAANISAYPSLKTSDMIQIGWVLVIP